MARPRRPGEPVRRHGLGALRASRPARPRPAPPLGRPGRARPCQAGGGAVRGGRWLRPDRATGRRRSPATSRSCAPSSSAAPRACAADSPWRSASIASFVSQIANPAYAVPIPAGDLPTIFEVCHLSPQEREGFLALYRRAHPERGRRLAAPGPRSHRAAHRRARVPLAGHRPRGRGVDPRFLRPHHPPGTARRGGPRRRRQKS